MSSILNDVKKVIGFDASYTPFDTDIIMLINSAFASLTQIGAGLPTGFAITDASTEWSSYSTSHTAQLSFIKQYICMKTKITFDPPTSSAVLEAYDKQIKELEWRIYVAVDPEEDDDDDE